MSVGIKVRLALGLELGLGPELGPMLEIGPMLELESKPALELKPWLTPLIAFPHRHMLCFWQKPSHEVEVVLVVMVLEEATPEVVPCARTRHVREERRMSRDREIRGVNNRYMAYNLGVGREWVAIRGNEQYRKNKAALQANLHDGQHWKCEIYTWLG